MISLQESKEPQLDLQELVRENAALQGALADLKQRLEDQAREVVLNKDSALHASGDLVGTVTTSCLGSRQQVLKANLHGRAAGQVVGAAV